MKSLAEMDQMIQELDAKEKAVTELRKKATELDSEAESLRMSILNELELQGVDSFKGSVGSVSIGHRFSVKAPKDELSKRAFKDFLESHRAFESLWTINHQTLNSWYKEMVEEAKARGEMLEIPGINPTMDKILTFRRSR